MRTRLFTSLAISALALTACGGDDGGGDGGGDGSPQDQVAELMLEVLDEATELEGVEGIEIDEDCIRDRVGELSDEDAQAIVDAGVDGEPDLSDEADLIGDSMVECVDMSGVDLGELDTGG